MSKTIVETSAGRIRGRQHKGSLCFRGVPYAASLRGRRRFLPPEALKPWTGLRDAGRSGPAAPQLALPVFSWINAAAGKLADDCLSLNVWTPAADLRRRPVLFWIHGGGFLVGSGSTALYAGADLARRGDVVVVTVNYRLGALGYAHLGTVFGADFERCTNLGVRDQIAALEWVRDNIERFGGDPGNVTVFGQSAGGMSVGALLGAPRARSLFHRAICMSGAAEHVIDRETAQHVASDLLRELGEPSPELLERIPTQRILQAQHTTMSRLADLRTLMVFLPMVDGDLIPEAPLAQIRRGAAAQIPILTGATLEEWKLFRVLDGGLGRFGWEDLVERMASVLPHAFPQAPNAATAALRWREALGSRSASRSPREIWSAFQTARIFHLPSARLAEAQREGGGDAWSYLFTWRPPALRRSLGAFHALDIPFVFGSTGHPLARPLTGLGKRASQLGGRMQDAWIQFAHRGTPGHGRLPEWPRYGGELRDTMVFGREIALARAPLDAERRLLERWSVPRAARAAHLPVAASL